MKFSLLPILFTKINTAKQSEENVVSNKYVKVLNGVGV